MTNRRIRDLHRLLTNEAKPYGATVRIEHTNGGHLKGIFKVGERKAYIITAFTPSCWRFGHHVRAEARRILRNLRA
jgi:hypothetical protein